MSDKTLASSSESMLLATQALPTPVVPAPTASQFSRELEDIRVAEALVGMRSRRAEHHSEVSHLGHNARDAGLGYRPGSGVA